MGLINDLKKLMFGAKSVGKSAANKTVEKGKEVASDIADKSGELFDKAKDKVEDVGSIAMDKAGDFVEKAKDSVEDIAAKIWEEAEEAAGKAKDMASDLTQKVKDKADDIMNPDDEIVASAPMDDIPDADLVDDATIPEMKSTTSAAKEAADKAGDAIKGAAQKAGETLKNLGDEFMDKTSGVRGKIMDKSEEVGGKVLDVAEDLGGKIMDKSEEVGGKVMDVAEDLGGKILETGGSALDKAKELGGKIFDKAEGLVQKAQQAAAEEDMDSIIDKAKTMGDEAAAKVQDTSSNFKEKLEESGDSLLDGKDSFFEKAKRFADGDYSMKGEKKTNSIFENNDMSIEKDPNHQPKKNDGTVAGFEDLDGDGDEIIDDAIIDED